VYIGWSYFVIFKKPTEDGGGGGGHDCMLVGFTTTYAISAYHH